MNGEVWDDPGGNPEFHSEPHEAHSLLQCKHKVHSSFFSALGNVIIISIALFSK